MSDEVKVSALIAEGQACLEDSDYDSAIHIGQQLELHQRSYAFELQALAYAGKEDLTEAINVLERGVSLVPDVWLLWLRLGNYYSDMARWDDARRAYSRALTCPHVDPSAVYYDCALLSQREGKLVDALRDIECVTSARLRLKAVGLRISIYTNMGNAAEAIRYSEQMLNEMSMGDEGAMEDDEAADMASLYGEYANAVYHSGDSERALQLAWQAVSFWKQQETVLWLIREIEDKHSKLARYHHLTIEGRWSEPFEGEDAPCAFFVTYGVVADSPDEALNMAIRFEPSEVRESLKMHECDVSPAVVDEPKGVYNISDYFTFPVEETF